MLGFKTFIDMSKSPKYVSVYYDDETQRKLREYCKQHGFPLTQDYDGSTIEDIEFQFHTTVFFSKSEHYDTMNGNRLIKGIAEPAGFEMLGKNNNIPVIRVGGRHLQLIRDMMERDYQMKDGWPSWKAHISLSYNYDKEDIGNIPLPDFDLVYDRFVIKDATDKS